MFCELNTNMQSEQWVVVVSGFVTHSSVLLGTSAEHHHVAMVQINIGDPDMLEIVTQELMAPTAIGGRDVWQGLMEKIDQNQVLGIMTGHKYAGFLQSDCDPSCMFFVAACGRGDWWG